MLKPITFITTLIVIVFIVGCVPPPPLEEGEMTEQKTEPEGPQLSKAERDSIIGVRRSFGHERWKNGDFEAAIRHFEVIREHDIEKKYNIYRKWADCYNQLGYRDSSRFAYEEGIKYFPDDAYLHSSLAILYRNERKYNDAIAQQKEAIRIEPDNQLYIRDLANMYESTENWDGAIETYQRLLELTPDDASLINIVNSLIRTHRNPEEYLKSLKDVVGKFPDDPPHRFEYARALFSQGDNEAAAAQFKVYTKLKPSDAEGWRNLARTQENLGEYSKAIDALIKVTEVSPESLNDIVAVGKGYLNLKQWVKARTWAQKALAKDSGYGQGWLLMGDIYTKSADLVGGSSPKYSDKLVFVIAYGLYKKAYQSSDPEARSDADRSMQNLKGGGSLPAKEERFMNKGKSRPSKDSYDWINHKWSEVNYIDSYLKTLD